MKPGRELDALVAEKVMGWKRFSYIKERDRWESADKSDPYFYDKTLPNYSTDIAAAWEVVEKCRISMRDAFVIIEYGEGWSAGWGDWEPHEGFQLSIECRAETAPHAICLAALKAVGTDIPE